jgi:hypothetical protein
MFKKMNLETIHNIVSIGFKTLWVVFKWSAILLGILVALGFISSFFVSGCTDGGLHYDNCKLLGNDVSGFMTFMAWVTGLLFFFVMAVSICGALITIIDFIVKKMKNITSTSA